MRPVQALRYRLGPVIDLELDEDALHVVLDGRDRDAQDAGNLGIGLAHPDPVEDLALARGQHGGRIVLVPLAFLEGQARQHAVQDRRHDRQVAAQGLAFLGFGGLGIGHAQVSGGAVAHFGVGRHRHPRESLLAEHRLPQGFAAAVGAQVLHHRGARGARFLQQRHGEIAVLDVEGLDQGARKRGRHEIRRHRKFRLHAAKPDQDAARAAVVDQVGVGPLGQLLSRPDLRQVFDRAKHSHIVHFGPAKL